MQDFLRLYRNAFTPSLTFVFVQTRKHSFRLNRISIVIPSAHRNLLGEVDIRRLPIVKTECGYPEPSRFFAPGSGLILSKFYPKSPILVVHYSDIGLQKILIGSSFPVDQEIILT